MATHRIRQLGGVLMLLASMLLACPGWTQSGGPHAAGAAGLHALHQALGSRLTDNAFDRPLVLHSVEGARSLQGDVHAVVDHPFTAVSAALGNAREWCEVLILHLNTKHCQRKADAGGKPQIELRIGKKRDQALSAATRVAFAFREVRTAPDYFAVELRAPVGPFDTSDYGILLEAVPLEAGRRTFVHMGYSFGFGAMSRMAMQLYLSTLGRDKVGFTVVGSPQPEASPQHVAGMRGLVERNTMRYYLAIDAYLHALDAPPGERLERRLAEWFDATERYARQLHEVDRAAYLAMKRREYQRQQFVQ
jgi:hypothetical protein